MKFFGLFRLIIGLQVCFLVTFSQVGRADEFLSALETAIGETRVQSVYYTDLIDYLEHDNRILWESGHKGIYPGLPYGAFSSPSSAYLMAQQSVVFWRSAEYQLEQLAIFYRSLPEGAYRTTPIQSLLFEIISEFSQSASIAFYDLHSNIGLLRRFYHSNRARSGYPKDHVVTQALLDEVESSFDAIYAEMKFGLGRQSHWGISEMRNLRRLLAHLPSSLLLDQYYFDFNQSVYLTQFLLRFYRGTPADFAEVEDESVESSRWARVIANYYNAQPNMSLSTLMSMACFTEKSKILLSEPQLKELNVLIKKSIISRNHRLIFSKKEQVLAEFASAGSSSSGAAVAAFAPIRTPALREESRGSLAAASGSVMAARSAGLGTVLGTGARSGLAFGSSTGSAASASLSAGVGGLESARGGDSVLADLLSLLHSMSGAGDGSSLGARSAGAAMASGGARMPVERKAGGDVFGESKSAFQAARGGDASSLAPTHPHTDHASGGRAAAAASDLGCRSLLADPLLGGAPSVSSLASAASTLAPMGGERALMGSASAFDPALHARSQALSLSLTAHAAGVETAADGSAAATGVDLRGAGGGRFVEREERLAAAAGGAESGFASAARSSVASLLEEEAPEGFDYLRELLEDHQRHQALKAQRRSPPLAEEADAAASAGDGGGSSSSSASALSGGAVASSAGSSGRASLEIHLTGSAASTYRTVMGLQSTEIRNREVYELVRALGGRLDFSLSDPRIVIPNRSAGSTGQELTFKMHFRHSGRESFPVGTLRQFFGNAIRRAGLEPYIRLD